MTRRTRIAAIAALAALAALVYLVVHLALVLPGHWVDPVDGEWDVMLASAAWADGRSVSPSAAMIRPTEPGSAVIAGLVSLPMRLLGLSPVAASRGFAALVGMLGVALIVLLAARRGGERAALAAGLLAAVVWNRWHHETIGVWGTSVEALLPLLGAHLLTLEERVDRRHAALAGVATGAALLLSWAALPALVFLGIAWVLRRWRLAPIFALAALAIWATPVLLDGGGELRSASRDFLVHYLVLPTLDRGGGDLPARLLDTLGAVPAALVGNPYQGWNTAASKVVSLGFYGGLLPLLGRPRVRPLALLALAWLLPLLILPEHHRGYPAAYRYWLVPTALGCAAWGIVGAELLGRRALLAAGGALAVIGLLALPEGRLPPRTRCEVFATTGAHRFEPRLVRAYMGDQRYSALFALHRAVAGADRQALIEGAGLRAGIDVARGRHPDPQAHWRPALLRRQLDPDGWFAWLRGFGCGVGVMGEVPAGLVQALDQLEDEERLALDRGLLQCGVATPGWDVVLRARPRPSAIEHSYLMAVSERLVQGSSAPLRRAYGDPPVDPVLESRIQRSFEHDPMCRELPGVAQRAAPPGRAAQAGSDAPGP